MRPANDRTRVRLHPVVVVTGTTFGILALFFVQFAIPYLIGPFGLLVVILLDVSMYLWIRQRRLARKRPWKYSRIVWGSVDRRSVSRAKRTLEAEVAATCVFVGFLFAIYVIGTAIRVEYWWVRTDVALYLPGSVMTTTAFRFSWDFRYDPLRSESKMFHTTEDH